MWDSGRERERACGIERESVREIWLKRGWERREREIEKEGVWDRGRRERDRVEKREDREEGEGVCDSGRRERDRVEKREGERSGGKEGGREREVVWDRGRRERDRVKKREGEEREKPEIGWKIVRSTYEGERKEERDRDCGKELARDRVRKKDGRREESRGPDGEEREGERVGEKEDARGTHHL